MNCCTPINATFSQRSKLKKSQERPVLIVGAGLSGLSCARRLQDGGVPFLILEADEQIGGRIKTDQVDGFLLNHGFQVLQMAYPEARKLLDYSLLDLKPFAPGAIIRIGQRFHRISDPRRRPRDLWQTLKAPIGTLQDRLKMVWLMRSLVKPDISDLFRLPDSPTSDFLKNEGFSETIIERFMRPFFAGVCLDNEIGASSRVFRYVFRIFAEGGVALPAQGMKAIPEQLAEGLPADSIRLNTRVNSVDPGKVILESGDIIQADTIVVATDGPGVERLLNKPTATGSCGEWCLYFEARRPPVDAPYLILNGDNKGWVNSLTVPSAVSPSYAPEGKSLISVVVIGHQSEEANTVRTVVRKELLEWFGPSAEAWRHIKTYQLSHALPEQRPPVPDPTTIPEPETPGLYVCGEHNSVPGIQWALLSGRQTAEHIIEMASDYRSY